MPAALASVSKRPLVVIASEFDTPAADVLRDGVETITLENLSPSIAAGCSALFFDVDLSRHATVGAIRDLLGGLKTTPTLIFVVDRGAGRHQQTIQANALGARAVVARPLDMKALRARVPTEGSKPAGHAVPPPRSIAAASRILGASFAAIANGAPLDIQQASTAGKELLAGVGQDGLHAWLEKVRAHHDGTFQHCLLVTGTAAAYASYAGLSEADRTLLATAALLHDIGKAQIPNSILDKPGKLTDSEFAIIKEHPGIGADYLRKQKDVPNAIIDAVLQHHEYLDGSGYPKGLCASEIAPIAKILTVCDVYGALIEKRAYKPARTPAEALYVLISMAQQGKVDIRIVRTLANALNIHLPDEGALSATG